MYYLPHFIYDIICPICVIDIFRSNMPFVYGSSMLILQVHVTHGLGLETALVNALHPTIFTVCYLYFTQQFAIFRAWALSIMQTLQIADYAVFNFSEICWLENLFWFIFNYPVAPFEYFMKIIWIYVECCLKPTLVAALELTLNNGSWSYLVRIILLIDSLHDQYCCI